MEEKEPKVKTVKIIKFIECNPDAIKENKGKNKYNDFEQILTLIGSSLKHHDLNTIYEIIKNCINDVETNVAENIWKKYGLPESLTTELLESHPLYKVIQKEAYEMTLCHMTGFTKIKNDISNNIYLYESTKLKFTEDEILAINESYQNNNNPLVFIRILRDGNTGISFVAFDNDKMYLSDISFDLTFDIFKESEQKENFIKVLNDSLDKISNLDISSNNLIRYDDKEGDGQIELCIIL